MPVVIIIEDDDLLHEKKDTMRHFLTEVMTSNDETEIDVIYHSNLLFCVPPMYLFIYLI